MVEGGYGICERRWLRVQDRVCHKDSLNYVNPKFTTVEQNHDARRCCPITSLIPPDWRYQYQRCKYLGTH
jgi:hypothetical protein